MKNSSRATMGVFKYYSDCFVCIVLILVSTIHAQDQPDHVSETNIASQCMHGPGKGLSFVSLYCGFQKVIQIENVFHGVHTIPNNDCSFIRNDCIAEAKHLYDWSKCKGKHNCVQTASYGRIEKCSATASYIQVEYKCVTEPTATTVDNDVVPTDDGVTDVESHPSQDPMEPNKTKKGMVRSVNICGNKTLEAGIVSLHSPGYPNQYPASLDCRCEIEAEKETSLMVNFQDIVLAMRESLCSDWLLVESIGQKGSRVVTCGDLQQKKKSLDTGSKKIVLHFHSTKQQQDQKFRGFRAQITTKPRTKYKLKCFQTDIKSLQLLANSQDMKSKRMQDKGMMLAPTNFTSLSQMSNRNHADMDSASTKKRGFAILLAFMVLLSVNSKL